MKYKLTKNRIKFNALLAIVLTTFSINAWAVFTYKGTHPSNQPITQLHGFDGGIFVGHDSVDDLDVYRYDIANNGFDFEFTFDATSVARIRTIDNKLVLLPKSHNSANYPGIAFRKPSNQNPWLIIQSNMFSNSSEFTDVRGIGDSFWVVGNSQQGRSVFWEISDVFGTTSAATINTGLVPVSSLNPNSRYCTLVKRTNSSWSPGINLFAEELDTNCEPSAQSYEWGGQAINNISPRRAPNTWGGSGPVVESVNAGNNTVIQQGNDLYRSVNYATNPIIASNYPIYDVISYRNRVVVLRTNGNICYTENFTRWTCVDRAPAAARQLTIEGNTIFVGTNTSELWSAPNPLINLPATQAPQTLQVSP